MACGRKCTRIYHQFQLRRDARQGVLLMTSAVVNSDVLRAEKNERILWRMPLKGDVAKNQTVVRLMVTACVRRNRSRTTAPPLMIVFLELL
ncbi:hypothetical protein GWI33_017890 [Rhynchophorus ferrugineus]|uniref:Uncharacterized protein n=1 Tax=Rhynchophorus ferrugineus TaxID=354439 RepID=A0A834M213_RHYFE|nr:hypothetical protein GWI33_017890 [Rhynchophorus ferrugineus]